MGYDDNFYVDYNIIGFTGNLNNNPTVYFASCIGNIHEPKTVLIDDTEKILYKVGHITQYHDDTWNIGRSFVTESFSCGLENTTAEVNLRVNGKRVKINNQQVKVMEMRSVETISYREIFHIKKLTWTEESQLEYGTEHYNKHTSRGLFTNKTPENISILAQAISLYPNRKAGKPKK